MVVYRRRTQCHPAPVDKRDFDQGLGEAEGRFSRFGSTAARPRQRGYPRSTGAAAVVGVAVAGTKATSSISTPGCGQVFTLMPGDH